jgi:hypothetical protein
MSRQDGIGHGGQLGKQGRILRGRNGGGIAGNRLGGERTGALLSLHLTSDGGALDREPAGDGALVLTCGDRIHNPLAKIERICFHGLHATTAATNLRTALRVFPDTGLEYTPD